MNKNRYFAKKLTAMLSVFLCIETSFLATGCQKSASGVMQNTVSDTTRTSVAENQVSSENSALLPVTQSVSAATSLSAGGQDSLSSPAEQAELYMDFMQKHRGEKEFSYYSLIELEAGELALLTTSHVEEQYAIRGYQPYNVSSECQIYLAIDGGVVSCGQIACGMGQWIHVKENMLLTRTAHSIQKSRVKKGDSGLFITSCVKETTKSGVSKYYLNSPVQPRRQATGKTYKKWKTMFTLADSVVFSENKGQTLTEDMESHTQFIPPVMTIKKYADVTGDGIKDMIWISTRRALEETMRPTIKVFSGATKKVIWKGYSNASAHAGYSGFYLYEKNGASYLMEWNPGIWQGMAGFYWKIFSLTEQGGRKIIAKDRVDFNMNPGRIQKGDFSKIRVFGKTLNAYLEDATVLIDTINYHPLKIDNPYEKEDLSFDYEELIRTLKEDMQ